jgi:hypothetical protein
MAADIPLQRASDDAKEISINAFLPAKNSEMVSERASE